MVSRQIDLSELKITQINTDSPIPLYYQVEEDLRNILKNMEIHAGDMLPTETDLAKAYRVGRHTVRTALSRLVNDGLISRRAGHGTIVCSKVDRRQFSLARSFTHQIQAMGLHPHSQLLHLESRTIQALDPRALQSHLGKAVFILDRLRFADAEPIGIQRSFILLERCPDLATQDFKNESLYHILTHRYQLEITELTHLVSAVISDKQQAELLHIKPRTALLVVNTTAYLAHHEMIEYSITQYRADKYEFTTTENSI